MLGWGRSSLTIEVWGASGFDVVITLRIGRAGISTIP